MALSILDCTIRDGGHLNRWRFDPVVVNAAFHAAQLSGVDYFEIGYRYPAQTPNVGPFATCPDELLFELASTPGNCRLAVMIDSGKCKTTDFTECLDSHTPVKAVRVAAYPFELDLAIRQIRELHDKGYEVFLNLMASSELSEEDFGQLKRWPDKHLVSALYFADSFGGFLPEDVKAMMGKLKSLGFSRIGFHPHNNLQMAFANTLSAIDEGVDMVDASMFGMGRGAGNLPIELLLGHLERSRLHKCNTVPYLDVIEHYFINLHRQIGWGYTLPGLMSGLSNTHPYYVDVLFKDGLYKVDEIWNALRVIKERCPISYSSEKMKEEMDKRFYAPLSQTEAARVCATISDQIHSVPDQDASQIAAPVFLHRHAGRKFLVIANGPSILKYRQEILAFIEDKNCVTIGMNNLGGLYDPDYHVFISRKRFDQYGGQIAGQSQLVLPTFFGQALVDSVTDREPLYFRCDAPCADGIDPVDDHGHHCMALNVAISAILVAHQMGASEIYAVGVDGYVEEENKNMVYFYDENNRLDDKQTANARYELFSRELDRVNRFLQNYHIPFYIITPTSHRKYFRYIDSFQT